MGTVIVGKNRTWQKKENNAIQEKTGSGFDTMLTMNVKPLVAGKYRFAFQGEARVMPGGAITSQPKFRWKVDGVTKGIRTMQGQTEWDARAGWDFGTFADGATPVIILEMQRFGGTETIEVQKLKLSIELMEP